MKVIELSKQNLTNLPRSNSQTKQKKEKRRRELDDLIFRYETKYLSEARIKYGGIF